MGYLCFVMNTNGVRFESIWKAEEKTRLISEINFENNRDFLFIITNQRYVYVSLNEQKKKKKKKRKKKEEKKSKPRPPTHILATLIRKQSS